MPERLPLSAAVDPAHPADELLEATLPPAHAHREGGPDRALQLLSDRPELATANLWVAAATGELDAARRFLAADPDLATTDGGTRHWDPLLYLCFSTLLRSDSERTSRMVEIARLLLDAGADPNSSWIDPQEAAGNRETPLYGAAGIANQVELARLLVERGADANDGETAYHMVEHDGVPCADFIVPQLQPLHRGMALGHKLDYDDYGGLRRLLELGADPNGPTPFANWPIHQAVWRGRHPRFLELLIAHGADVDRPNREGRTAYALAARGHETDLMEALLAAGAREDLTPLDAFVAACAAGDREAAQARLVAQPTLREGWTERDDSEICEAAASGRLEAVRTMLDLGWKVDTRGVVWGETPAHRAALEGHVAVLELLIAEGTDLMALDRCYQGSPLGWAQHEGRSEIFELLRRFPDRLDAWDAIELGLTERALAQLPEDDPDQALRGTSRGVLLRLAAGHGNRPVVDALLALGADPTIRTSYGMCAIDVARARGHSELAACLESLPSPGP